MRNRARSTCPVFFRHQSRYQSLLSDAIERMIDRRSDLQAYGAALARLWPSLSHHAARIDRRMTWGLAAPYPSPHAPLRGRPYGLHVAPACLPGGCASFGSMNSIALAAQWIVNHPWAVLGALVILAAAIRLVGRLGAKSQSRKALALLRPAREQARFDPLTTVYSPKSYRRERRTPRK